MQCGYVPRHDLGRGHGRLGARRARRAAIEASIPRARTGTFTEPAQAVAWLALDAHYITGQVLAVGGGRSTWLP